MSDLAALWEQSKPIRTVATSKAAGGDDLSSLWEQSKPAEVPDTGESVGAGEMKILPFGTQLGAVEDVAKRRLASGAAELASGHGLGAAAGAALAPGAVEEYRKARDARTDLAEQAKDTNPVPYYLGEGLGLAGQALLPGSGAKTFLGNVGQGAAYGAASGLSDSKADLTKGDFGQAAEDTGLGALGGALGGAAAHGLGRVAQAVAQRAGAGTRLAEADQALKEYVQQYVGKRSAQAALGGEVAAGMKALEHAKAAVANELGNFSPEEVEAARAFLTSPKAADLERNAAKNAIEQGADRLNNRIDDARDAFEAAKQAMRPEAIEAGADEAMQNPMGKQIWPRVVRYASRAIPPAIGAAVGGIPGAVLGFGASAVMGSPGTSIANAMRNPSVRRMAWQAVQSGAQTLGKFGPLLQRAASEGGVGLARLLHEQLLDSDPDYQQKVMGVLQEAPGGAAP